MRHPVYVPLREAPGELRPAFAKAAGAGRFVLLGPMPRGEQWQFEPGDLVECESRKLVDGSSGLVVTTLAVLDPEDRKTRNVYAICGAIVGAVVGAALALWIDTSLSAFFVGAVVGALVFAGCSVRWGDSAWLVLSRFMGGGD